MNNGCLAEFPSHQDDNMLITATLTLVHDMDTDHTETHMLTQYTGGHTKDELRSFTKVKEATPSHENKAPCYILWPSAGVWYKIETGLSLCKLRADSCVWVCVCFSAGRTWMASSRVPTLSQLVLLSLRCGCKEPNFPLLFSLVIVYVNWIVKEMHFFYINLLHSCSEHYWVDLKIHNSLYFVVFTIIMEVKKCLYLCLSSGSSRLQYWPQLRGGALHWLPLLLLQTLHWPVDTHLIWEIFSSSTQTWQSEKRGRLSSRLLLCFVFLKLKMCFYCDKSHFYWRTELDNHRSDSQNLLLCSCLLFSCCPALWENVQNNTRDWTELKTSPKFKFNELIFKF